MKTQIRTILFALMCIPALYTNAQLPILNSHPSAPATIFLDFDGHTVDATIWTGQADPLLCAGSGLDSAKITEVFNRIAEDYRPFEVNVTTDSTKFIAAPIFRRIRVVITTTSAWYPNAGGVAYVGSFTWGDDTPCFAFSGALGYSAKNVAEAAAHEAGHSLGLYHQAVYNESCALVSSYNSGVGTGEIGWAPIMGVGYSKNFTLWNNGPSPYGCTESQNDLYVITNYNGFSYRDDDHSDAFNAATNAVFTNNQFEVNGIIERNTDKDLVKFIMPVEGELKLNAVPYSVGANNSGSDLDMQITLLDESQNAVAVYNPGNTLNLVVDTVLEAGTYYARIEGKGNEYAPAYASLGSYSLQASFLEAGDQTLPLKKLELKGIASTNKHQLNWVIDADEKVTKQTIEVSTNGQTFTLLTTTSADNRSYAYIPSIKGVALYRINVTFNNGRQYYSNTISLRGLTEENYKPTLNGNIIASSNLAVNSPANYSFTINDATGRIVGKGQVKQGLNTVNTSVVMSGMYFIIFTNGKEQWTEKFVKQ